MAKGQSEVDIALRRLVGQHGIPLRQLALKLDVSAAECLRWWTNPQLKMPIAKIQNLASHSGSSLEDIVALNISKQAVEIGILDRSDKINPCYTENAFSYSLATRHIVEYIALRFGEEKLNFILARLGVHRQFFENTSNRISLQFHEDILREYRGLGATTEDIIDLSKTLFLTTEDSSCSVKPFVKSRTYSQGFVLMAESVKDFEENFEYKFEVWPDRMRVVVRTSEKLSDAMRSSHCGSLDLHAYKFGLACNMITAYGLPPVRARRTKCISQGDKVTIYEAEYPSCHILRR